MALTTDFTNQVADAMDLVEFTHHAILVIAEEASKLGGQGFEFFLPCLAFRGLLAFSLSLLVRFVLAGRTILRSEMDGNNDGKVTASREIYCNWSGLEFPWNSRKGRL